MAVSAARRPVPVARNLKDRRLQRALMQFFKPENYFEVRESLVEAGRTDLNLLAPDGEAHLAHLRVCASSPRSRSGD